MNTETVIDALNFLIEINNDRIEGYQTASGETDDAHMKTLFADLGNTSRKCKSELEREVLKLGGEPTESTRITGKFFRVWMDMKAALSGKDTKVILSSCEYGEDAAVTAYEDVLKNKEDLMDGAIIDMIENQFILIKADRNKIREMRNSFEPVM